MRAMLATMVCVGLFGCNGGKDTGAEEADFEAVELVFTQSCAFSGCHGGGAGGLTLTGDGDHGTLVDVASADGAATLVIPGDADNSYLIQKMEGSSGITGDVMPPTGALDQATIDLVREWIDSGAAE